MVLLSRSVGIVTIVSNIFLFLHFIEINYYLFSFCFTKFGFLTPAFFVLFCVQDDGTGFVRLALVPVHRMMDKEAHSKYAFHFTCMNRGPHHCYDRSYDVCGNDAQGMAWRTFVQVPTSYPDGIYVLGWSWYGGGDYKGDSFFGDYYSCSFIRIHGGVSVTNEFQPLFDGPKCLSATDRLGVCWKEPCHISQRVYPIIPAEFNGRRPSAIRRAELEHDMDMTTSQEDSEMISEASGDGDVSAGARGIGSRNHDNDRDGRKREEASSTQEKKTDEPIDTRVFSSGAHAGSLKVCFLDFATWNKVPIHDGGVYLSRDFPRGVTVEAFYNGVGDVNYVDFLLDDKMSWREKSAPYVLNGNKGQHIRGWTVPLGRTIKIEVVVMTKSGHSEIFEADVFFK